MGWCTSVWDYWLLYFWVLLLNLSGWCVSNVVDFGLGCGLLFCFIGLLCLWLAMSFGYYFGFALLWVLGLGGHKSLEFLYFRVSGFLCLWVR